MKKYIYFHNVARLPSRILRSVFLGFCMLGGFSFSLISQNQNVVLIMADDLGWSDLGCQGSEFYLTPNIDALSEGGMRFARYYASPNCAPTRAMMMSGQNAPRTGVYSVSPLARGEEWERKMEVPINNSKLDLDLFLLPQIFKNAGYSTAMYGKWHLGREGQFHPSERGFDEAVVCSLDHFRFKTWPEIDYPEGIYQADFLTDRALEFMDAHQDEPFFIYLSHFAVHVPIEAKPELEEKWKERSPKGNHWDPTYAAMIQSVDDSVGRIVSKLEELGLTEETLVIFTSDNGGVGGYYGTEAPSEFKGYTDNAPLRGGKGTFYEGGIRVPLIACWPSVIEPGSVSKEPISCLDYFPTFLEFTHTVMPVEQVLDGVSFLGLLKNPDMKLEERALYWHFPGYLESYVHSNGFRTTPVRTIIRGNYKLMDFLESGEVELYDLSTDIGELDNLAVNEPQRVASMIQELDEWCEITRAHMPIFRNKSPLVHMKSVTEEGAK